MSTLTASIAQDIVYDDSNRLFLIDFFRKSVSNEYCDGDRHQIYLDLSNYRIFEICEARHLTTLSREDGSFAQLHDECTVERLPENERYNELCGHDLDDLGLENWFDYIKERVRMVLEEFQAKKDH